MHDKASRVGPDADPTILALVVSNVAQDAVDLVHSGVLELSTNAPEEACRLAGESYVARTGERRSLSRDFEKKTGLLEMVAFAFFWLDLVFQCRKNRPQWLQARDAVQRALLNRLSAQLEFDDDQIAEVDDFLVSRAVEYGSNPSNTGFSLYTHLRELDVNSDANIAKMSVSYVMGAFAAVLTQLDE